MCVILCLLFSEAFVDDENIKKMKKVKAVKDNQYRDNGNQA